MLKMTNFGLLSLLEGALALKGLILDCFLFGRVWLSQKD